MKISEEIINDIRNSASISEVIGHYIPLIKKGRGYTAVCPFHDDHDPSLSISEEKKIYKCFVCGDGGNVFTFVMHYKKCSFLEAVSEVAKIIGKPLDIEIDKKPKIISKYQKYYDLLKETISFTNYVLSTMSGKEALAYLHRRGLSDEIIKYFDIGYNPKGNVLYKFLKAKNYPDKDMLDVDIVKESSYGDLYDVFHERITFPIHDIYGNPIAFSARSMAKDNLSKYINTQNTLIYHKGNCVYNYHRAKESARKEKRIIITEGVMDVIAFKRAGIENVVATLGTALTQEQLQTIASLSRHIVFCYDGDKAGKSATVKAIDLCLKRGIEPYVIVNDSSLDPDEIISKGTKEDLVSFASKEVTGIEFALEYYKNVYPLNNYTNKKKYNLILSEMIAKLKDKYDRDNFYALLEKTTGLPKMMVSENNDDFRYSSAKKSVKILNGLQRAEYIVISQLLLSKKAADIYRHDLGYLLDETDERLALLILDDYRHHGNVDASRILDETNDEKIKGRLLDIMLNDSLPDKYSDELFKGAINKIKLETDKNYYDTIAAKIISNENINTEATSEFLKEYSRLAKRLGGKKDGRES